MVMDSQFFSLKKLCVCVGWVCACVCRCLQRSEALDTMELNTGSCELPLVVLSTKRGSSVPSHFSRHWIHNSTNTLKAIVIYTHQRPVVYYVN